MSLVEQFESHFLSAEIEFQEFASVYTSIASALGEDHTLLRLTDRFSDHWEDMDVYDLLVGLCRRMGISQQSIPGGVFSGDAKIENLGDIIRVFCITKGNVRT
jgi:hypothetical protein